MWENKDSDGRSLYRLGFIVEHARVFQDFQFFSWKTPGVLFKIEPKVCWGQPDEVRCEAPGYGESGKYGAGAVFTEVKNIAFLTPPITSEQIANRQFRSRLYLPLPGLKKLAAAFPQVFSLYVEDLGESIESYNLEWALYNWMLGETCLSSFSDNQEAAEFISALEKSSVPKMPRAKSPFAEAYKRLNPNMWMGFVIAQLLAQKEVHDQVREGLQL